MKTIIGLFNERENVEDLVDKLHNRGFDPTSMSILMKDRREAQDLRRKTGSDVTSGAVTGATTGAIVGGLLGLLSSFVLPGVGSFLIGGPIASALGLSGAAAATTAGVATGAVAGGILGALMGLGLSHQDAQHYESQIKSGAILVAVPIEDRDETWVKDTFADFKAYDLKTIDMTDTRAHEDMYADNTFTEPSPPLQTERYAPTMAVGAKGGEAKEERNEDKKTETYSEQTIRAKRGETIHIKIED